MKSRHSEGKWELVKNHPVLKNPSIMAGKKVIAELPDWRGDSFDRLTQEEAESNAKLIAAAPELLKRLFDFVDAIEHGILPISKDSLYYTYAKSAVELTK